MLALMAEREQTRTLLRAKIQKDFDNESTFPAFFEKSLKKFVSSE